MANSKLDQHYKGADRAALIFKEALNAKSLTEVANRHDISIARTCQIINKLCRYIRHRIRIVDTDCNFVAGCPVFLNEYGISNQRKDVALWFKAIDEMYLPVNQLRVINNFYSLSTPKEYYENGKDLPPIINHFNMSKLMSWADSYLGAPNVNH